MDYELGLDGWNVSNPTQFWTRVQSHLRTLPWEHPRPITQLFLAGDSVKNEIFLKALRDALAEVSTQLGHTVQLDSSIKVASPHLVDPVFAAARGAAIYARRRQEAPADCAELKACEEKRNREREGKSRPKLELK